MKIIIVATKQASKFLSNRGNLGHMGKHSVAFGDIVKGELDAGPHVWNGERWVVDSHNVLIHSPQITNKDEAESLVSSLQSDGDYNTVIIGCDPGNTLYHLDYTLEKVFGDNNVNIVYPSLYENYPEFDSLRDRVRSLLNLPAVEEADVADEDTVNAGSNVIVVASKIASEFLSDSYNLGETPERPVVSGNIVEGTYSPGRIFWNGERWEDVPTALVVHNRQIINGTQVEPLISSLVKAGHNNVIIGCDPYIAKKFLVPRLKVSFLNSNIHLLSPSLEDGREETLRLREDIQKVLNPESTEKVSVVSEETDGIVGTGNDNPQEEARHLRVTLTNSADPKSAPSIIDVFFNEGDHLELDFRNTNQETK